MESTEGGGGTASVNSTAAAAPVHANPSPAAADFGKGVLLDNSVRQRTGISRRGAVRHFV